MPLTRQIMPPAPCTKRFSPARQLHNGGFTLIEVLVVLILVGMISGVLFQALERAYQLQNRFGLELFKVQHGQMTQQWYRQTVQGLYPDQPDGENLFRGDEREFSGLSLNPLDDNYGTPTPILWRLASNLENDTTQLIYVSAAGSTPLISWHSSQASFVYFDDQQTAHTHWPPPLGQFKPLPSQIQLQTQDNGEPITLVASPMGPTEPTLRPQNIFGIRP